MRPGNDGLHDLRILTQLVVPPFTQSLTPALRSYPPSSLSLTVHNLPPISPSRVSSVSKYMVILTSLNPSTLTTLFQLLSPGFMEKPHAQSLMALLNSYDQFSTKQPKSSFKNINQIPLLSSKSSCSFSHTWKKKIKSLPWSRLPRRICFLPRPYLPLPYSSGNTTPAPLPLIPGTH